MEIVVNILKVLGEMVRLFAEGIGLGEKWEVVAAWLKAEKSHRQIVLVVGLLAASRSSCASMPARSDPTCRIRCLNALPSCRPDRSSRTIPRRRLSEIIKFNISLA